MKKNIKLKAAVTDFILNPPVVKAVIEKPTLLKGGQSFRLTHDYNLSGIIIPKGYKLRECSDGWFQAFNLNDFKFFIRISAEALANIIHKEKEVTTQLTI